MPKVTQLVLNLQSKPGVLVNVADTLGKAGINIEGSARWKQPVGEGSPADLRRWQG